MSPTEDDTSNFRVGDQQLPFPAMTLALGSCYRWFSVVKFATLWRDAVLLCSLYQCYSVILYSFYISCLFLPGKRLKAWLHKFNLFPGYFIL